MLHTASKTQAERLAQRCSRGRGPSAATRSATPATTSTVGETWNSAVDVIDLELPVVLSVPAEAYRDPAISERQFRSSENRHHRFGCTAATPVPAGTSAPAPPSLRHHVLVAPKPGSDPLGNRADARSGTKRAGRRMYSLSTVAGVSGRCGDHAGGRCDTGAERRARRLREPPVTFSAWGTCLPGYTST